MARQGRRQAAARRAQSQAVGTIHREQGLLRASVARTYALLPLREQGLPGVRGKARAFRHASGAGRPADVFGAAAEVPSRRTGPLRRAAAVFTGRSRAARDLFRSIAV